MDRLIIQLENAVQLLDFKDDNQRTDFIDYLIVTMNEDYRQKFLTWKANREYEKIEATQNPKSTPPVPDYIQRERERVANRPMI